MRNLGLQNLGPRNLGLLAATLLTSLTLISDSLHDRSNLSPLETSLLNAASTYSTTDGHALQSLQTTGLSRVHDFLSPEDLAQLTTLAVHERLPTPQESSKGRFHHDMRTHHNAASLQHLVAPLRPLIATFLSPTATCTQLQILDTLPNSPTPQNFHADNTSVGVTILIPFSKGGVSVAQGPTELLVGSLRTPVRAVLLPGDALLFDSRLWHRGLGNETPRTRRVLVVRFDEVETPPPGVGFLGTAWVGLAGAACFRANDFFNAIIP